MATNKPSSSPWPAPTVDAEQSAGPEPDHEKSAQTAISTAPVRKPNILRFWMVTVKEPGKPDRCRLRIIPSEAPDHRPAPASNNATQNSDDSRQYCTATTSHQTTNADNKGVCPSGDAYCMSACILYYVIELHKKKRCRSIIISLTKREHGV
jgi:hypothetical protein